MIRFLTSYLVMGVPNSELGLLIRLGFQNVANWGVKLGLDDIFDLDTN